MQKKISDLQFLICGLGSIGERHFKNLKELTSKTPLVYRTRGLPPRTIKNEDFESFSSLDEALKKNPDAAIICNPTSLHIETAIKAARAQTHLFIEKPLGHELSVCQELKEIVEKKNLTVMVGYMMRFHPIIEKIKMIIDSHELGKVISYRAIWAEYLPDWHPWEDYRESYAAKKELGGGPALTLSHEIDLALYFFKDLKLISKEYCYEGPLDITTEQSCRFNFQTKDNAKVEIALDFIQSPPARTLEIEFTKGHLSFDYYKNQLTLNKKNFLELDSFDRNSLFKKELEYFIHCIENRCTPSPNIDDGMKVLELIES